MKEYTIEEFRRLLAKSIQETMERHTERLDALRKNAQLEELLKSDWRFNDFKSALEHYGWGLDRETKHVQFSHPTIRDQRLILSHDQKRRVPSNKVNFLLGDAGLRINRNKGTVEVDPNHRFAQKYAEGGFYHPPADPNAPKSWESGEPGVTHVPIHKLISTRTPADEDVQGINFSGTKVPAIHAVDAGDGTYLVEHGDEALEAAKRAGYNHAPVKIIKKEL